MRSVTTGIFTLIISIASLLTLKPPSESAEAIPSIRFTAVSEEFTVHSNKSHVVNFTAEQLANANAMAGHFALSAAGGLNPYQGTSGMAAEQQLQLFEVRVDVYINDQLRVRKTLPGSEVIGFGAENATGIFRLTTALTPIDAPSTANVVRVEITPALPWAAGGGGSIRPGFIEVTGQLFLINSTD